ncbi:hypothetical protein [Algicola sagamiensis]|uniref:hypothetical protein n=1 Tax=Algicola sagamiensis TaxID=163869 RepID=UPI000378D7FD|nr:hypothetical protein [Algicola sagamiensis]
MQLKPIQSAQQEQSCENTCQICGASNRLVVTWHLSKFNLLCSDCEHDERGKEPIEKLFREAFDPESSLDRDIAIQFISSLKAVALAYKNGELDIGDALCQKWGISL